MGRCLKTEGYGLKVADLCGRPDEEVLDAFRRVVEAEVARSPASGIDHAGGVDGGRPVDAEEVGRGENDGHTDLQEE